MAVGQGTSADGNTYTYLAGKWSAGPTSPVLLSSVSCASADFCVGVGFLNYASAFIYNGTVWSAQIPISAAGASISCPTTTFCAVVSGSGDVLYYQGGHWSRATSIDPNRGFSSISCPTTTFCAAVDDSGNALIDESGRWSTPDYAKPLSRGSLTGVSCAAPEFCVAVDLGGAAYIWDGSQWSPPETISDQVAFSSVSCPTTSFCAAVGQAPVTSPTKAYIATWTPSGGAVPAAPANLQAKGTYQAVGLSWSKPANDGGSAITGYTVLWRKATSTSVNQANVGPGVTNDTVTSLDNGTAYQFAVEAVNASWTGPATPWATATPTTTSPPLAPTDLTAVVKPSSSYGIGRAPGEIDLSWAKPAPGGCPEQHDEPCTLGGYTLSYDAEVTRTNARGQVSYPYVPKTATFGANATSGSVTSFLNLDSDTFELVADNHYGPSPGVQVTVPLEVAPGAPDVTAAPGAGQVTLAWTEETTDEQQQASGVGPLTFSVYYGTSVSSEVQPPSAQLNLQSTALTYHGTTRTESTATVSGLANLTRYYFKVIATDPAGSGPPSSSVGATTLGLPGGAPSGLSAKAGNRQVSLTRQAPTTDGGSPLTAYDVYMGTSSGGEAATAVVSTAATSAVVQQDPATVDNGTKYYFIVKAVNADGTSPASNEASATPGPGS
jgi:hypothetical protein